MKNRYADQQYNEVRGLIEGIDIQDIHFEMLSKMALIKHSVVIEPGELGRDEFDGIAYIVDDLRKHSDFLFGVLDAVLTLIFLNEKECQYTVVESE